MGIYTNQASSSIVGNSNFYDYVNVPTYCTEGSVNFHELGILAAAECRNNSNAIMKSIGIHEACYLESTGSTNVIYESVDISGIFNKIKMFFKKVIEKIKKIIHTFIAKMSSIFSTNAEFVRKYNKEIIKKWANVSNNWSISGYKFTNLNSDHISDFVLSKQEWRDEVLVDTIGTSAITGIGIDIADMLTGNTNFDISAFKSVLSNINSFNSLISKIKENKSDAEDLIRGLLIDSLDAKDNVLNNNNNLKLDASEYTEKLTEVFRNGETSKDTLEKKDINITEILNILKDSTKTKTTIEKFGKNATDGCDKAVKCVEKMENEIIKAAKDEKDSQEKENISSLVSGVSIIMGLVQSEKEYITQAVGAMLQAHKDRCNFYKAICVKVIGQSKKMTEESYNYSNNYSNSGSFFDSIELV